MTGLLPDGRPHTHQGEGDTRRHATVSQEPGPPSPTNRGHVPELSANYRGHAVHHEPGPHTVRRRPVRAKCVHRRRRPSRSEERKGLWPAL